MVKNEILKKDIITQLYWDSRVDASKAKVEIREGKVFLEGVCQATALLKLYRKMLMPSRE